MSKRSIFMVVAFLANLFVPVQPASATASFVISTVAGTGVQSFSGDGGPATSATMQGPAGVVFDSQGNLFIIDNYDNAVRKVSTGGTITTVAGYGNSPGSYSGDGGPATSANLNHPQGLGIDSLGRIYIADSANNRVRRVNADGTIVTVAGTGSATDSGDSGAATSAGVKDPEYITFDTSGNMYISEWSGNKVRRVDTSGFITTILGDGTATSSGDGGLATSAKINAAGASAFDASGNLYVVDGNSSNIRKINTSGIISTIAGTGSFADSGDGGPALSAALNGPSGLAIDSAGNIYIPEYFGNRIRRIDGSGNIATIIGTGTAGYSGDGGAADAAKLRNPTGLAIDAQGNLDVAELGNWIVRKVALIAPASGTTTVSAIVDPAFTFSVAGRSSVCNGQSSTNFQTGATSTAVTLGHLTSATVGGGAQDLSVTTNAANGFVVYLKTSGTTPNSLRDGSSHSITDVTGTRASPGSSPAAGTAGFGYTSSDTSTAFTSNTWAKLTNSNDSVLIGSGGTSTKTACVGYEVAVASTTPAAAYTSLVVYTAIPIF